MKVIGQFVRYARHGFLLLGCVITGCATKVSSEPALTGRWVLISIDGKPTEKPGEIYFEIRDGNISGYDGCNRFGGSLDDPSSLRKSGRGCVPEPLQAFPLDLASPSHQLNAGKLQDNTLTIRGTETGAPAIFRRSEE